MSHDEYTSVSTPQGVELEPCPVCGASAELWRHSRSPSSPTETAVCCRDSDPIGPQGGELASGCLLYMPPNEFYRGTIREAVKYWNEYAKAVKALRAAQAETDHLLSNPANAAHLARSIEQARNGQVQERQLVKVEDLSAMPNCGARPGDGSICTTACRLAEELPPVLFKDEVNDE